MNKDVKCPRCKCYRTVVDFLKNGRILKSCINCRNHANNYRLKHTTCIHNIQKYFCKDCGGSQICLHKRQKNKCIDCGGSEICLHNKHRYYCKKCSDPIKISIQRWIISSKESDKNYNRFDPDKFIDKCFLKELIKDYRNCYYCKVELQYIEYNDTLATIERLNNSIGHIKSNCVLCCKKCNLSRERK